MEQYQSDNHEKESDIDANVDNNQVQCNLLQGFGKTIIHEDFKIYTSLEGFCSVFCIVQSVCLVDGGLNEISWTPEDSSVNLRHETHNPVLHMNVGETSQLPQEY